MMTSIPRVVALAVLIWMLSACASDEAEQNDGREVVPPPPEATADRARQAELVEAAERVMRFLQGELPFSELQVADTVILRLSPQGGGSQLSLPRDSLRAASAWIVPTDHGHVSLVPPPGLPHLKAKSGVHFNCMEYPLATVAPDLARLPHVGVRLAPHEDAACLQTWNLTLVFEGGDGPPVLAGVLYDQWEW